MRFPNMLILTIRPYIQNEGIQKHTHLALSLRLDPPKWISGFLSGFALKNVNKTRATAGTNIPPPNPAAGQVTGAHHGAELLLEVIQGLVRLADFFSLGPPDLRG